MKKNAEIYEIEFFLTKFLEVEGKEIDPENKLDFSTAVSVGASFAREVKMVSKTVGKALTGSLDGEGERLSRNCKTSSSPRKRERCIWYCTGL